MSWYRRLKNKKLFFTAIALFVVELIIVLSYQKGNVAENFYARGISRPITIVLQKLNSLIPFSLTEFVFVSLIVLLVAMIVFIIFGVEFGSAFSRKPHKLGYIFIVIMVTCIVYSICGSSLYYRDSIYEPLGIVEQKVDDAMAEKAAEYFIMSLAEIEDEINRDADGNVLLPYSFSELNDLLNEEYRRLSDGYFLQNNTIKLKKITLSKPMTYTFITGVYVACLGEASINTNVPAKSLPVTMAHEMAHSKGVIREDEANAIAYYLLITSDDVYLRYCGLMAAANIMYGKVSNAEYRNALYNLFPEACLKEYAWTSSYYEQYDTAINIVSDFINNINLKSNGVSEGTTSYSNTDTFLCSLYVHLR